MDIATLFGIVSAFGLVIIAIFLGGGVIVFFNLPALLIVIGGTLGATMISFPIRDMFGALSVLKNAFFPKSFSVNEIIGEFVNYAAKARREGILALEADINSVDDKFIKRGLQLSVDGIEPQSIQTIMATEIDYLRERHLSGAEIFTTMGTFAPALGMIGTLIGLVNMLQSMDNPSTIGPAMAVALLTTFYGSVLANIVFLPIAGKLRTRSKEEVVAKEMIAEGVVALSMGENPRIIEQKMMAFVSPKKRRSSFE